MEHDEQAGWNFASTLASVCGSTVMTLYKHQLALFFMSRRKGRGIFPGFACYRPILRAIYPLELHPSLTAPAAFVASRQLTTTSATAFAESAIDYLTIITHPAYSCLITFTKRRHPDIGYCKRFVTIKPNGANPASQSFCRSEHLSNCS